MVYCSILALLASIASIGYQPTEVMSNASTTQPVINTVSPSVDQVAAADLAARTAEVAGLSVTNQVSSMSITMAVKNELSQTDEAVITKPQIFEATSSSALTTYKVQPGDTVPSVAAKFGITGETLKWANNLTTDALIPNTDLTVPTSNGVVYTTKDGDTLQSIADKYKSDPTRITSKNNLELSGITPGLRILLPDGVLPENERPGYTAPVNNAVYSTGVTASNYAAQAGNRYYYGYCTWYTYNRRAELGRPVGSFWGDAVSWAFAAKSAGYGVTRGNPAVGDVMQNGGGYGHVAVVEEVHPDGSIRVSEMNYVRWGVKSYRDLDAGAAAAYTFIK